MSSNLKKWHTRMAETNTVTRALYQLAFFRRNLRKRMFLSFDEISEPESIELILIAWEFKLKKLEGLVKSKKYYKKAEEEIKFWRKHLVIVKKHPEKLKKAVRYGQQIRQG